MLDKFLEVAYRAGVKKTASRALVDKLKEFPIEELKKLANGDETCKLAYAMDCAKEGGGDGTWLGKYTGTPLFSKAVELEKALLQLDMEDQQLREQERAQRPQPSDTWAKRDAIGLQKRMLDLDLVTAENGGAPAEGGEELAVAGAPAAKEEKAVAEQGPPQGPPGAAEAGPSAEDEEAAALELAAEEAAAGGGAPPPQEAAPQQAAPPKPKPKAPPKEEEAEEEGGPKIEVKQSSAKVAAAIAVGSFLAKTAKPLVSTEDSKVRAAVEKKFPGLAKESAFQAPVDLMMAPELLGGALGANKGHAAGKPGSGALRGALGSGAGAMGGQLLAEKLAPGSAGASLLGAGLGGYAGYKALTHKYNKKEAPVDAKTAGILGTALSAGKAAIPAIGGALGAGKSLATSAYKSGGLGQVASSFGNVAKSFAQKNPLAAAGIAGGGGLLAGKMLSGGGGQPRQ